MIEKIPRTIKALGKNNEGKEFEIGLNIRWSVTGNTWVAGYGKSNAHRSPTNPKFNEKLVGIGDTANEALKDLVKKMKS